MKTKPNVIAIASDHAGFRLKEELKDFLKKKGLEVKDLGTYSSQRCDYPGYAASLAQGVSSGVYPRGILICMTGIGNSIVANRFFGVRASLCTNVKTARLTRQHNDSNILVLGACLVSSRLAKRMVSVWLNTDFEGGRHLRRLNQIKAIERKLRMRIR